MINCKNLNFLDFLDRINLNLPIAVLDADITAGIIGVVGDCTADPVVGK